MQILEYDQVDPHRVLNLNLLSLDWPLSPERAELIRSLDPRTFPFFGLYAVENGEIAGQVLVYRLPMMSIEGPEDVGGVAAVCTHPAYVRRGIATLLMEESHKRIRTAGMRFSTLGTSKQRAAYSFYRKLGYIDVYSPTSVFSFRDNLRVTTGLRAKLAEIEELPLAHDLYRRLSQGCLGFTRRHESFLQMMISIGDLKLEEIWLLWNDNQPVGYALARVNHTVLEVSNLQLLPGVDPAGAVSAISRGLDIAYHWVRLNRPVQCKSFTDAGYPEGTPCWDTFMVKPLSKEVGVDDARRLFQIGTDQFMFSPLDVT